MFCFVIFLLVVLIAMFFVIFLLVVLIAMFFVVFLLVLIAIFFVMFQLALTDTKVSVRCFAGCVEEKKTMLTTLR